MSNKPSQVIEFEYLIDSALKDFLLVSSAIGEPVTSLANKVKNAFERTRDVIIYGLANPEPPKDHQVMQGYYKAVQDVVDFREDLKDKKFANHFSTVREAIVSLGWINVKPAPKQFIRDMREAGEYWANRVLLNFKGDKNHGDWVAKWNQLITDLEKYVHSHFLTGFTWGKGGMTGSPPLPPPPPPPEFQDPVVLPSGTGADSRQALLNELNVGSDITRNLKPVNRNRPAEVTSGRSASSAQTAKVAPYHPPKFCLDGKKWLVEYQKQKRDLVVSNDDMSQCLSMYNCSESCVEVKNKMNSISVDNCTKCVVLLSDIIASVDVIRCRSVEIHCQGSTPLINVDNCDSVQVYAHEKARGLELISSKSNSINICLVKDDGDYKEISVPEQIKTVISGEKLVSSVVEKI